MTPDGRLIAPPTAQHPAYYLPVIRGYEDYGHPQKGEELPSDHDVVRDLAPELAKAGYLVVDKQHATPELVVDLSWGKIGKKKGDARNEIQRDALVLGKTATNVIPLESYGHDEFNGRPPRKCVFSSSSRPARTSLTSRSIRT